MSKLLKLIYVPAALRLTVMDSVHTSPGFGHPGNQWTLSFLCKKYWWPNMTQDVTWYFKACSVCTSQTPCHLPAGNLVPLPVPNWLWSNIGIHFGTDLPPSESYTCILVVVVRFSKACKLIPFRGLPTALETAESLFHPSFITLDCLRILSYIMCF